MATTAREGGEGAVVDDGGDRSHASAPASASVDIPPQGQDQVYEPRNAQSSLRANVSSCPEIPKIITLRSCLRLPLAAAAPSYNPSAVPTDVDTPLVLHLCTGYIPPPNATINNIASMTFAIDAAAALWLVLQLSLP